MSSNTTAAAAEPGLISGHASLVKGAVEKGIGSLTGNAEWTASGQNDTQAGVAELRSYNEQHPPAQNKEPTVLDTLEKKAGQVTGCEGMEDRASK